MSEKYSATTGTSWEPIGYYNNVAFKGSFDGNGKTITGLYINRSEDHQGLFGYINGGTVENVALVACMVAGGSYHRRFGRSD